MNRIVLFVFLLTTVCSAQHDKVDYIGYADNNYYEVFEYKASIIVLQYHVYESRLVRDTLSFVSLEETKNKLNFETFIKSKRLSKDWYKNKHVSFNFKTDTIYTFQFRKNGNKELWYSQGVEGEEDNSFWCKPKKQPLFIPIKNKQFEVMLVKRRAKLSMLYYDKRKGIQGNIRY